MRANVKVHGPDELILLNLEKAKALREVRSTPQKSSPDGGLIGGLIIACLLWTIALVIWYAPNTTKKASHNTSQEHIQEATK